MRKIFFGVALSISCTSFAFAANPATLDNFATERNTPPQFCCHTGIVYVGNVSYGEVTSCAATCQAAQDEWESTRQKVIKAVLEASTDIN